MEELVDPREHRPVGCFRVNLNELWCDCGKFQSQKFPCFHAVAGCASIHLDCMQYVDKVYKLENIFKVYQLKFDVVGNQAY